jgi:hypothetical protein
MFLTGLHYLKTLAISLDFELIYDVGTNYFVKITHQPLYSGCTSLIFANEGTPIFYSWVESIILVYIIVYRAILIELAISRCCKH